MQFRKKNKTVGQFIIDLTPLLDVIFILLIVVLCFQDNLSADAKKKYADAEQIKVEAGREVAEVEGENSTIKKQLENYENINNYVDVITIYAQCRPDNHKYRDLYVQINSGETWEKEINPSNESKIWDECKTYIEENLEENNDRPTVLTITDVDMLYRDEESIKTLYDGLSIENKYIKNNPEEVAEDMNE